MTIALSLSNVANLQDTTTAQTVINNNSTLITDAFETAIDSSGDQMLGNLDMNSFQVLNLPPPASLNSPLRLGDTLSNAVAITVPPVGTSGATVPLLNANNTWSGVQTFGATDIKVGSAVETFPSSGLIVGTTDTQTLTNKILTSPTINGATLGTSTLNSPTIVTPTVTYGTSGNSTITASSTNTGNQNQLVIANGGTVATAGTTALFQTNLSAGTNAYTQLFSQGGATPAGTLQAGTGMTGGLNVQALGGNLNLTSTNINTDANGNCKFTNPINSGGFSRVTTNQTYTSNTTLANTGLTATLIAGLSYIFEATLFLTLGGASTGGLKIAMSGTSTATNIVYWMDMAQAASTYTSGSVLGTALNTAITGGANNVTQGAAYIKGLITVNAGGTLTLQASQASSTVASTVVLVGSYMKVFQVT